MGLERGPLSLVSTTEELLERTRGGCGLEIREYGRRDPSRWPRGTLYPQKLALTSPTSGGRRIGIVRSRTKATEFSLVSFLILQVHVCTNVMEDSAISVFKEKWCKMEVALNIGNQQRNYSAVFLHLFTLYDGLTMSDVTSRFVIL
jgi:hypothetical protein